MGKSALLVLAALALAVTAPSQTPFPLQQYGNGGCGLGDYVPTFHTGGEFPIIGNSNFQVVSRNLRGQAPGILWISRKKLNLPIPGLTLHVDLSNGFGVPAQADNTAGVAGAGMAKVPLPIPNELALVGGDLYLEAFYLDAAAPLSIVHTQGLHLNIRRSLSKNITALYDRLAYQKYVTNATIGQAVWQLPAEPGLVTSGTGRPAGS